MSRQDDLNLFNMAEFNTAGLIHQYSGPGKGTNEQNVLMLQQNSMDIVVGNSENNDEDNVKRPIHESYLQRRKRQDDEFQIAKKKHSAKVTRLSKDDLHSQFIVKTENKFQPLTTISELQCIQSSTTSIAGSSGSNVKQSVSSPIMTTQGQVKIKKPKPIILVTKIKYFRLRETFQTMFSVIPVCQFCPKGLKIQPNTQEDAEKLITYFKDQKMEFYTFPSIGHKTIKVVMRGLPIDTPTEDIEKQLRELNYPIESIRQLKRRMEDSQTGVKMLKEMPLWVLSVYDTPGSPNIMNLTGLYNLKVTFSEYVSQGGPQQCYRCQGFGHKSSGCFVNVKCVRCGKNHLSKDCTKDPLEPAKCANCNKEHPASYRQCEKFLAYANGRKTVNFTRQPQTTLINEDFPQLPFRQSLKDFKTSPIQNRISNQCDGQNVNMFQELKDMMHFIQNIMSKFRNLFINMKKERDPLTRILTLAEGLSTILEDDI